MVSIFMLCRCAHLPRRLKLEVWDPQVVVNSANQAVRTVLAAAAAEGLDGGGSDGGTSAAASSVGGRRAWSARPARTAQSRYMEVGNSSRDCGGAVGARR